MRPVEVGRRRVEARADGAGEARADGRGPSALAVALAGIGGEGWLERRNSGCAGPQTGGRGILRVVSQNLRRDRLASDAVSLRPSACLLDPAG